MSKTKVGGDVAWKVMTDGDYKDIEYEPEDTRTNSDKLDELNEKTEGLWSDIKSMHDMQKSQLNELIEIQNEILKRLSKIEKTLERRWE